MRDFSVNHKLPYPLGLAHTQWLEPVAGLTSAHGQFIAGSIKVKIGSKAVIY